jgi:hypothetical protein
MFEYVASGLTPKKHYHNDGVLTDNLKSIYNKMRSIEGQEFSFLYNAFSEKSAGKYYKKVRDLGCIYNVHADSGGLQMITLNKTPTKELRHDVYVNQAMNSDIAMSFDEIPLIIESSDGKAQISDLSTRFFDMENLLERAADSGQNLKDQIEYFQSVSTRSKPLVIIQGNCLNTYKTWTSKLVDVMGEDLFKYTGGLAMSPTSIGMGLYEDCVRAIALKTNPYNKDKVHLLGIGSVSRMLPFVIMNGIDWFGKDYHISYDSTSHSRELWGHMGYRLNGVKLNGKSMLERRMIYDHMDSIFSTADMFTFEKFCKWHDARGNMTTYCELSGIDELDYNYAEISSAFLFGQIYNFMKDVDFLANNVDNINIAGANVVKTLAEVQTHEDGIYWLKDNARYLKSQPVPKTTERQGTLSNFFT